MLRTSSPTGIWAVGSADSGSSERTLILRGNGHTLQLVSSPNPGTVFSELNGVSATSPGNAWAVGGYSNGSGEKPLILHWNGTT